METKGLSEEALSEALQIQEDKGRRVGEILIRQKAISEADLLRALGIQFDLPVSSTLPVEGLRAEFTERVPIQFLKKYNMVPVISDGSARIAITDPLLFQPLDDLVHLLGLDESDVMLAPLSSILSVIN